MQTIAKVSPQEAARRFVEECRSAGWSWSAKDRIVTIRKSFPEGNSDEFVKCDNEAHHILRGVPLRGGSVWGTDGGSVGGYSAMVNGCYVLNKSGSGKAFLAALERNANGVV